MRSNTSKGKKQKKRGKKGVLIALLLLAVFFVAGFWGYKTLRVAHIEVEGNESISSDEIVSLSGIDMGTHLYSLDLDAISRSISKQPFVEVLSVERKLPDTVAIAVRERKKDAVLQYLEQAIFIDRSGRILEISSGVNISDMLVIKGMSVSGLSVGEPVSVRDEYQFAMMVKVINALYDSEQIGWYQSVDMSNPIDIRLETVEGITVEIGQADAIETQLVTASKALNKCKSLGIASGLLDVSDPYEAAYSPPEPSTPSSLENPPEGDGAGGTPADGPQIPQQ